LNVEKRLKLNSKKKEEGWRGEGKKAVSTRRRRRGRRSE
jgi:hypothetical protein